MLFSVLIPARNEEALIGQCLTSIREAASPYGKDVEIIVCLNRCTDNTEAIARSYSARITHDDSKCLSRIRNEAARQATGDILVTIDADSTMTPNLLMEIDNALNRGDTIGGGTWIQPNRLSLGIFITGLLLLPYILFRRISAGCFWCHRTTFEALGGFDESLASAEDIDFALRLKRYGKMHRKHFSTLWRGYIRTSCRKFDIFGDWFGIRNIFLAPSLLKGNNQAAANRFWYDVKR